MKIERAFHVETVFLPAVLFAGLFVCLSCSLIFCEHNTPAPESPVVLEKVQESVPPPDDSWFIVKSTAFTIYVRNSVDIKTVCRKLGKRGLFVSGVYDPNPTSAPPQKMAYMFDRILRRVKEILDMYPKVPGLNVRLFKDREELSNEYLKIFGTKQNYKSFYVDKYKTIYTSEESISDSVIAHEMAHAVIDNYFSTVPPPKVAEVLASYVDVHLED